MFRCSKKILLTRDGQLRKIYYSRIVEPNPDSKSKYFLFATSTISMKAFLQVYHNSAIREQVYCSAIHLSFLHVSCVFELVFELLHAYDAFTKRKSVTKQRDKACKQDIN